MSSAKATSALTHAQEARSDRTDEVADEDGVAVIAILTAMVSGGARAQPAPEPDSWWSDQPRVAHLSWSPGPGQWWAAGLPR